MHNHMQNKQRSCTLSRLHPVGNQLSQYASSTQTKEIQNSNVAALEGQNPFKGTHCIFLRFFCGATIMRFAATLKIHKYTFFEGTSVPQRRGAGGGGSLE